MLVAIDLMPPDITGLTVPFAGNEVSTVELRTTEDAANARTY